MWSYILKIVCLIFGHKVILHNIEKYSIEQILNDEYKEDYPHIDWNQYPNATYKCPRCYAVRNASDYFYGK